MQAIGDNTNSSYRQIWLQQLGIVTEYQIRKLQKKVGPKMYSNCKIISGATEYGYILGIETNINASDEDIINYFIKVMICSL